MNRYNYKLGKWGEMIAKKYLRENGYDILEENYRIKIGEIDLIVCNINYIVFVEVKTRCSAKYGPPQSAVNYKKINTIRKIASYFLNIYKNGFFINYKKRFDVIAITLKDSRVILKHLKNVF